MKIRVNKEIADYEENVLAGMTMRQAVLGIAGVIVIAGAYFLTMGSMATQLASWVAIGFGMPCFLFAFVRPHKMPLEKYIALWVTAYFLSHWGRKYKSENGYWDACFAEEQGKKGKTKKTAEKEAGAHVVSKKR